MCGIAGLYFNDPQNSPLTHNSMERMIDELLLGIEHRGHDATGVAAVMPDGELHIEKADLQATAFTAWRRDVPNNPQTVLLHTRAATQGSPMNLDNNHPIRYNNAVMTHNGHISNDNEIFEDEDLNRLAEVDSEAISALFDKYGIDKCHIPLGKLDGGFAVAVCDLRKPNSLVLAKGSSSPLYYYEATEGIVWASTELTIQNALANVLGLKVERHEISMLHFGDILFIENGEREKLKFKGYQRPYVYHRPSDNWHDKEDTGRDTSWFNKGWREHIFSGGKKEEEKRSENTAKVDPHFKPDQLLTEFWENEKHDIVYSIECGLDGVKEKMIFKRCDGCNMINQTTLLTIIEDDSILCEECLEDYDEKNEEPPAVVHEVVLELVAEKFGTKPEFVNWMLFESDEDEIETAQLLSMYIQFTEEYDKVHEEFTGEKYGCAQHWVEYVGEADGDNAEWTSCDVEEDEELIGVEAFADTPATTGMGII